MKRDDLLRKAGTLINGDRAKDYGDAHTTHERIAIGWDVIISGALESHGTVTAAHVALMMDWLKTVRLLQTLEHPDSWIDKLGYSAIGGEIALKKENNDG